MSHQYQLPPHQAWTFARLPAVLAAHNIEPDWVLHVGAHHGEEVDIYRHCGFRFITLVEPDPRNVEILVGKFSGDPHITIHQVAVALTAGKAPLHYADRTVWSGLRPHPTADGTTVTVDTVNLLSLQRGANVLVIDTQGSELDILETADLGCLDLVIIETTRRPDDTAAPYEDTRAYMVSQGWQIAEDWCHDDSGYLDSVYVPWPA